MDTIPSPTCPACGTEIPADAPQALCPRCALGGAAAPTDSATARGEPPSLDAVRAAFPQLEILGLLGAGGMGFVFQARQPHLERLVALKLLPVPLAADPHFSERFLREGRLLARLAHPGIVSVHDFGQAGGFAYLLMEYVDGVNLRVAMNAGRFTPAEALALVPGICEALQYAHERGVLHRDIKPENLLLDAQGRVKIADFGIAKLVGAPARGGTLTASGARLGTPQYMAPEQIEQPAAVDHRADIYSLGVVFYEMLTGELPLGRFAPPSRKTPLDARVDRIVLRALAKERELRQQSAAEVKTEVEGLAAPEGRTATISGNEGSDATAPAGARPSEYKSARTLFGLPLLHIVRGSDPVTGRVREARGIVAIGGHATGVLAIGGLARGAIAFGGVAFGLFAFGGLAFGVATVGGLAVGLFSFGGLAVGLILALGGVAAGWNGFGGLVVAHQGIGGFMAVGHRLPATGAAGTLIRSLPWLWIPIVPLSLVPGLVSAWAYRKLDRAGAGPRPNPWPHEPHRRR
ncbi:MAG: serine/threonine protein kinase [Verrucomicrobiae bacterium]|nr:serine/threonine protein kinase [Verrucomicrobiae bacterium]